MGWVAREPDPLDARSSAVRLTPKGMKLANRVIERHFAEQARLLEPLGKTDRETLARLLSVLAAEHEKDRTADAAQVRRGGRG
jgi:DNA-binding MarR family transcriptional regulator